MARLHQLGNLTLTTGPLNTALSNGPWHAPGQAKDKRRGLLAHSLLRLNTLVVNENPVRFDEQAVDARGEALAAVTIRIWPGPDPVTATPRAFAPSISTAPPPSIEPAALEVRQYVEQGAARE